VAGGTEPPGPAGEHHEPLPGAVRAPDAREPASRIAAVEIAIIPGKGLYFITICTQNHLCLFGKIENDEMILSDAGKMVERQWRELVNRFDHIELHEYIVMPNHFHGIVEFVGVPLVGTQNALTFGRRTGHPQGNAPTEDNKNIGQPIRIGDVVGAFKSLSTN
jgi:hypothetical protein